MIRAESALGASMKMRTTSIETAPLTQVHSDSCSEMPPWNSSSRGPFGMTK